MEIEFYLYNDELWCIYEGKNEPLTEKSTKVIECMLSNIREHYPAAYEELTRWFERSSKNVPYFQFLIVDQFCRCNFGRLDPTRKDVEESGKMNFEKGYCPMAGRCPHHNIVCSPRFNSRISEAEKRVMKLLYEGRDIQSIASDLYLSPYTVKNHIKSVYLKLGIHEKADFIKYVNDNNLFDE